jgi:hypothetical protein
MNTHTHRQGESKQGENMEREREMGRESEIERVTSCQLYPEGGST